MAATTSIRSGARRAARPSLLATLTPAVWLSLAAVYVIWSSTYLALGYMVRDLPPLAGSGARFFLAGLVLYVVLRVRGVAAPSPRQWGLCVLSGTAMFFGGNGFVAIAAREAPSGLTAMSIGSMPLFLTAMEAALGQGTSRRQWLGLALGFAGVCSIGLTGVAISAKSFGLLALAPVGWAAAALLVRRCQLPAGAMAGAAQLMGGGSTLLLGGHLLGERFDAMPGTPALVAFGYLVVFGSIVGYSAALHLLRSVPGSLATSYAYVNPVLAILLGAGLAGERVGGRVLLACGAIVAGVALLLTSTGRREDEPRAPASPAVRDAAA